MKAKELHLWRSISQWQKKGMDMCTLLTMKKKPNSLKSSTTPSLTNWQCLSPSKAKVTQSLLNQVNVAPSFLDKTIPLDLVWPPKLCKVPSLLAPESWLIYAKPQQKIKKQPKGSMRKPKSPTRSINISTSIKQACAFSMKTKLLTGVCRKQSPSRSVGLKLLAMVAKTMSNSRLDLDRQNSLS